MQRISILLRTLCFVGVVGMVMTACSGGSITTSSTSAGAGTTPTVVSTTGSTSSITMCNEVAHFAGASAASLSTALFPVVTFPAGSVGYVADNYETNGYQYRIINYCTPASTTASIQAHFAATFPAATYHHTATFPLRGDPSSACGDPYCWSFGDAGPQYYAGLEFLSGEGNIGSVVTYDLRLIIPPLSSGSVTIHDGDSFTFMTGAVGPASGSDFTMHLGYQIFAVGTTLIAAGITGTNLETVAYHQLAGLSYTGNFINFVHPGSENTSHIFPFTLGTGSYAKVIFANVPSSPTTLQVHWVLYGITF